LILFKTRTGLKEIYFSGFGRFHELNLWWEKFNIKEKSPNNLGKDSQKGFALVVLESIWDEWINIDAIYKTKDQSKSWSQSPGVKI